MSEVDHGGGSSPYTVMVSTGGWNSYRSAPRTTAWAIAWTVRKTSTPIIVRRRAVAEPAIKTQMIGANNGTWRN
ncbi:MAG: hypothetical protein OES13_10910 [Acidimicrobiia bacterium]|nr:hypothetical protein [Acidimicrobiia bacterium]